ncbi:hypothetical protein [Sulfurospirillum arcachonense]|uniref:hypothetical protein n=1 Tax=Sulfurospirillum arcachonense TaxID=57666 RepID=UPI000468B6F5|nr:hypothetical protein [Sulfurospirillum arcachonense]
MAKHIIEKINNFSNYKFDEQRSKVVNLKNSDETNIDEFLDIQYLLDCNRVRYYFEKNFEIQIIK